MNDPARIIEAIPMIKDIISIGFGFVIINTDIWEWQHRGAGDMLRAGETPPFLTEGLENQICLQADH